VHINLRSRLEAIHIPDDFCFKRKVELTGAEHLSHGVPGNLDRLTYQDDEHVNEHLRVLKRLARGYECEPLGVGGGVGQVGSTRVVQDKSDPNHSFK
jgi:hypothetical protein